jgi:hypothetical protein
VPILARVERGALPPPIADALARGGVHLPGAPLLLTLVPNRGGKVDDRSEADLRFFLGAAGIGSGMLLLMAPMVWLMLGRKLSKLEATARRRLASPA